MKHEKRSIVYSSKLATVATQVELRLGKRCTRVAYPNSEAIMWAIDNVVVWEYWVWP